MQLRLVLMHLQGEVTLTANPDADTQDQYSFTVVATDAAHNVSSQSVMLDINDLDDADPIITSGDTADSIDEKLRGRSGDIYCSGL